MLQLSWATLIVNIYSCINMYTHINIYVQYFLDKILYRVSFSLMSQSDPISFNLKTTEECLAGSFSGVCYSWFQGCEFKPRVGCGAYLKKKQKTWKQWKANCLGKQNKTSVDHLPHTNIFCDFLLTTLPDSYHLYFINEDTVIFCSSYDQQTKEQKLPDC